MLIPRISPPHPPHLRPIIRFLDLGLHIIDALFELLQVDPFLVSSQPVANAVCHFIMGVNEFEED